MASLSDLKGVLPWQAALVGILFLGAMVWTATQNYLLFHGLAEISCIGIGLATFFIAWNVRQYIRNNYLLFVGISCLFVTFLDLLHTLAYKGMGVFQGFGNSNLPTQLWIAARYMESVTLLLAPVFLRIRLPLRGTLAAFTGISLLILAAIFHFRIFPVCFVDGSGLTPFKIMSEYVICAILAAAGFLLWLNRNAFDPDVLWLLVLSILATMISEFCFTLYATPVAFSNELGHLFKVLAFFFMYRAIIVNGLQRPYAVVFRDLSKEIEERKLVQQALSRAKEAAEAANLAKSVFLANMSHELRTPLNAVLGFAQILRSDATLRQKQRDNLDIILRSGEHLLALINNVLEISKIEAGATKPAKVPLDLLLLLDSIVEMMRVKAYEKGLEIDLECSPNLPRGINADERKLKQVLLNLVGNAVKFTMHGFIALKAWLDASRDILVFEVQDSGPGIDPSVVPKLFERFEQGEGSLEGAGLGLYICKKLVEVMGGQIRLTTELGKGSIFSFEIPYEPAAVMEPEAKGVGTIGGRLAPGQSAIRVLIAEDKEENRQVLADMLRPAGFEVNEAKNGAEAVRMVEANPPDLVLMDLRMPVMDGYEAIRRIKSLEKGSNIPVIAISASVFEEDRQKVLVAGADAFLRKPIRMDHLFQMIRQRLHVDYVYEEQALGTAVGLNTEQAKALVAKLPKELVAALKTALDSLDIHAFKALLRKVSGHDRQLADGLQRMADGYRISALMEIFVQSDTHE